MGEDIIGRTDLLRPRSNASVRTNVPQPAVATQTAICTREPKKLTKTDKIDLSAFYTTERPEEDQRRSWVGVALNSPAHSNGPTLADSLTTDDDIYRVIESNSGVAEKNLSISNTDRALGARVSGIIARKYGDHGFKGQININFTGSSGQSFGVFLIQGVNIRVSGDCNDYVGKGMNGGSIVAVPPEGSNFEPHENVIAGNTCLYGATGGKVYLNGRVGERFGVRNAGCQAVIEGSGDHLGEYMTNGVIVAIGSIGRNVGAGMSGGLLYVYDPDGAGLKVHDDNKDNVLRIRAPAAELQLRALLEEHVEHTGSPRAKAILNDWAQALGHFWQVAPVSEQESDKVRLPEETQVTGSAPSLIATSARKTSLPHKSRGTQGGREDSGKLAGKL